MREQLKGPLARSTDKLSKLFRKRSGLQVRKLEYSLRLKIKPYDWLLADTCPQAVNHMIVLYFESKNEVKFYNLEARSDKVSSLM